MTVKQGGKLVIETEALGDLEKLTERLPGVLLGVPCSPGPIQSCENYCNFLNFIPVKEIRKKLQMRENVDGVLILQNH